MEILAALLTIAFAWRKERFWPAGLLWIVGAGLAATAGSALLLTVVSPETNLQWQAWAGVFILEAAVIGVTYGITRGVRALTRPHRTDPGMDAEPVVTGGTETAASTDYRRHQ